MAQSARPMYSHSHWHKHRLPPFDPCVDLRPHWHTWIEKPDDCHEHRHPVSEPHMHGGGPRGLWSIIKWRLRQALRRACKR